MFRRPEHQCGKVPHRETGIDRLRLQAREQPTSNIDYESPAGLCDYAIRASAVNRRGKLTPAMRRLGSSVAAEAAGQLDRLYLG